MSSDFSLPIISRSVSIDFSPAVEAISKSGEGHISSQSHTESTANYDMNSVKDLKVAELQGKKISLGEEELIKVIERANKAIQGITTTFEFRIHEATKEIMVKVLDKETGKVIREIPPEKVLDMVAKLWEKAGILVDERG